jgi:hypothetical protein
MSEASDLADELEGYARSLRLEKDSRERLARFIKSLQGAISRPIVLDAAGLSGYFPGAREASLVDGEKLVVSYGSGRKEEFSVLYLDPERYLAVVKCAAASVVRIVEEEEEKRAAGVKPSLVVSARLEGGKLAIFDWRGYRLLFSNRGAAARGIVVSVTADGQSYGPFDLSQGQTEEVVLRHFRLLQRAGTLHLRLSCRDQDGRRYAGVAKLKPNFDGQVEVALSQAGDPSAG